MFTESSESNNLLIPAISGENQTQLSLSNINSGIPATTTLNSPLPILKTFPESNGNVLVTRKDSLTNSFDQNVTLKSGECLAYGTITRKTVRATATEIQAPTIITHHPIMTPENFARGENFSFLSLKRSANKFQNNTLYPSQSGNVEIKSITTKPALAESIFRVNDRNMNTSTTVQNYIPTFSAIDGATFSSNSNPDNRGLGNPGSSAEKDACSSFLVIAVPSASNLPDCQNGTICQESSKIRALDGISYSSPSIISRPYEPYIGPISGEITPRASRISPTPTSPTSPIVFQSPDSCPQTNSFVLNVLFFPVE